MTRSVLAHNSLYDFVRGHVLKNLLPLLTINYKFVDAIVRKKKSFVQ